MECDELTVENASSSNDLDRASSQSELRNIKNQEPNTQKRVSLFPSSHRSSISNTESYSCRLSQHQYHYIQYPYPAAYYEHINQHGHQMSSVNDDGCHCRCVCGNQQAQQAMQLRLQQHQQHQQKPNCHSHQNSVDSQMSVAVIVHRQAGPTGNNTGSQSSTTPQSEKSLLNHSYQALAEEKPLNNLENSKLNISCECDLECTCGATAVRNVQKTRPADLSDVMLAADEITVSESDNNSTMIKKKKTSNVREKLNTNCCSHDCATHCDPNYNSSHIDIYSDGDGDGDAVDACFKTTNDGSLVDGHDHRPPLPPRLPPRPRNIAANLNGPRHHAHGNGVKKYVVWCLLCGGFSCLLGVLFLGVYFLLHSYTITVGNFETVPTFVPATLLVLTGLCIMSLARRKNRYSYLIKLSGACGLISALTCALVTVTTTVLHMSRLQALRTCEYAQKTRTCTCYSEENIESHMDRVDKGVRLVFDSLSDCGVVHGSLYSCLRAIFGLSVAGVLIAVFSCMLVYQLLSHERKKMYWEQLELRCRSLYTSQQGPGTNMGPMGPAARGAGMCRCCEQCHAHRQGPVVYPWVTDDGNGEPRFWTGQPPGNFYSPNPGSEELHLGTLGSCRVGNTTGHNNSNTRNRSTSGWSWPRMPWQRNSPDTNSRFRQTPSSPDSQYGFSNSNAPVAAVDNVTAMPSEDVNAHNIQTFNIVPTGGYGVWGPPPPYSDPNSPARYYQYIQPNACNLANNNNANNNNNMHTVSNDRAGLGATHINESHITACNMNHHRTGYLDSGNGGTNCCNAPQNTSGRNSTKRQVSSNNAAKVKSSVGDYENTPSDSDCGGVRNRSSNTLPTRKLKKRVEASAGVKSIGPNSQSSQRVNVQQVFANTSNNCAPENGVQSVSVQQLDVDTSLTSGAEVECNELGRLKRGVENCAFQTNAECGQSGTNEVHDCDPIESEVYFADVSSCCNMSVKNDNYYDDANHGTQSHRLPQQAQAQAPTAHHHHHQHQGSNCSHSSGGGGGNGCQEDYLAQRFGHRENSIRSRLPFPQTPTRSDDYEETAQSQNHACNMQKELSRQSMCSVESETKTEFTDLSPATPCSNKFVPMHFVNGVNTTGPALAVGKAMNNSTNFVASFPPYCSEAQSLEAHRRNTKNISDLLGGTKEAHYEVINDTNNTNTNNITLGNQFTSNIRSTHQLSTSRTHKRNELISHKSKSKSQSRERLDAGNGTGSVEVSALSWSENGGGGDTERMQL